MTPNERLVAYMRRKAEIVGMPEFFTEEDEAELISWENAGEIIGMISFVTDDQSCPWCLREGYCDGCGYASRHGTCSLNGNDTYVQVISKLDCSICSVLKLHKAELEEILGISLS